MKSSQPETVCKYPEWIEGRMREWAAGKREAERFLDSYDKPMSLDGLRVIEPRRVRQEEA